MPTTPVEMMLFAIAGWFTEEQRHKIEVLREFGVVRCEQLGGLLNHSRREAA